jgi:hypothetical protein
MAKKSADYRMSIFDAVALVLTFFFQLKNKWTKFFSLRFFSLTAILFLAKQVSETHRPFLFEQASDLR